MIVLDPTYNLGYKKSDDENGTFNIASQIKVSQ